MEPDESAPFGAQMTSPGAISGWGLISACRFPMVGGEMQSGFGGILDQRARTLYSPNPLTSSDAAGHLVAVEEVRR